MTNRERTAEARRRVAAATSRASERRERERAAPLLCEEAPGLLSLAVEVTESGQGPGVPDNTYTRRFALETAPALFLFACGEHLCEGGGHDISLQVMAALRVRRSRLRGETTCPGMVGDRACTRKIRFELTATFEEAADRDGGSPTASVREQPEAIGQPSADVVP